MFVVHVTWQEGASVETRRFARLDDAGVFITDALFDGAVCTEARVEPDAADDVLAHVGDGGERAALMQDAPTMTQRGAQP